MKLWLTKNSEVPVRVQLAEQIVLGIASGDLRPDEKLPSTRELARRFGIHQNTVSAVYRSLAERGCLENRKGSGVFVTPNSRMGPDRPRLDDLFAEFSRRAETAGYTDGEVREHLGRRLVSRPPNRILVIESDEPLRNIIVAEVRAATGLPTEGMRFDEFAADPSAEGKLIAAMFDEKARIEPILPPGSRCVFLSANSVPESLSGRRRPPSNELIAIVSGWKRFLSLAQVYLLAAGVHPEMIAPRLTAENGWRKSLTHADLVICDSLTARKLTGHDRVRVFPLLAKSALDDLKRASIGSAANSELILDQNPD